MPDALPHPYFFTRLLFPPSELRQLTEPRFRSSTVSADGVTLDPTWLAWLERVADQARLLEPVAGISWLEIAHIHGQRSASRYGFREHGSLAGSARAFARYAAGRILCALPDAARVQPGRQRLARRRRCRTFCHRKSWSKRKRTFTLPWEEWLRTSLRPHMEASLQELGARTRAHLHAAGVSTVWDNFLDGQTTWSRPWSLYVLNEWCRRHLS